MAGKVGPREGKVFSLARLTYESSNGCTRQDFEHIP